MSYEVPKDYCYGCGGFTGSSCRCWRRGGVDPALGKDYTSFNVTGASCGTWCGVGINTRKEEPKMKRYADTLCLPDFYSEVNRLADMVMEVASYPGAGTTTQQWIERERIRRGVESRRENRRAELKAQIAELTKQLEAV